MTSPLRSLALACAVVVVLASCKKQEQQAMPPPDVGVLEAKPQSLPLQRELVGRLSAYRSADVRARVAGVLEKRLYTEGTDVKEGQPLFQIDPAPLRASLASAQGQLASAEATYANAKVAAARARSLAPQAYVSRSDLDSAEATERTSAASVQQARAAVETARINLGYATVTAPIAGRAGKQQVTEGALVGQSDTTLLTTIDQLDPLYVNFSMSSDELAQLRQAQAQGNVALNANDKSTVQVKLGDGSTYTQPGMLDFSDTSVDPSTGSVTLRALLPNPDRVLLPGAFVSFAANLGQRNNVYLIPQEAIQRDAQGAYALVVGKDGKVVRKNVATVGQQENKWIISSGLQAGDQIIVSGLQKAKEGMPAKAIPWTPGAPGQGAAPQGQAAGQPQGAANGEKPAAAADSKPEQP
ncbi:efflux RND transporter periplasmic adaptor subunit [Xanthomonas hyacinthi]|uniref:Efflux RND transporter periplasmic adaptor subunit n=1 Tax=Xanthomonas hyacinthi TaxID=56455 RepID=A0A2S7F1W5_9XANT|nr:efflux RND transporter periplasmic adaptor subunit [Xanthomonas hyacinthi]KLD79868.1 GntR family transcriptional regulator [Xanthomonas hyacinthi DSM 19077]PPU99419.1 efflux RND transporter periplasmic adaptor subunit [Xanthomonas hyacinthi]QGY78417.1 efflux RND transporter periplasmic adaptor subunit [Xanthomonas hyacinthi]